MPKVYTARTLGEAVGPAQRSIQGQQKTAVAVFGSMIGGTPGVYGAYSTATSGLAVLNYDALIVAIHACPVWSTAGISSTYSQVALATGAAGSEKDFAVFASGAHQGGGSAGNIRETGVIPLPYPIFVPAGSSLSCRTVNGQTSRGAELVLVLAPVSTVLQMGLPGPYLITDPIRKGSLAYDVTPSLGVQSASRATYAKNSYIWALGSQQHSSGAPQTMTLGIGQLTTGNPVVFESSFSVSGTAGIGTTHGMIGVYPPIYLPSGTNWDAVTGGAGGFQASLVIASEIVPLASL